VVTLTAPKPGIFVRAIILQMLSGYNFYTSVIFYSMKCLQCDHPYCVPSTPWACLAAARTTHVADYCDWDPI
jgi:hypothetical protein